MQMRDVKITVLETTFNKKLAGQYGVSGLGTCPYNKVGQEYLSVGGLKLEAIEK